MATEQGQYALVSYFRFKEGKTTLYDMTDVVLPGEAVAELIDGIGAVTLDSKNAIETARAAYDTLSAYQKTLVLNYETLTAAEASLKALQNAADQAAANAVVEKIAAIGTVTPDAKNAIEAARTAYDALTAEQKMLVTNYSVLTAAEKTLSSLISGNPATGDNTNIILYTAIMLVSLMGIAALLLNSKKKYITE